MAMSRDALKPMSRTVSKSSAAARIAQPERLRSKKALSAMRLSSETTMEMAWMIDTCALPMAMEPVKIDGTGTACPRAEMKFWKMTWSSMATAKLVMSSVAALALRTGRKAVASMMTAAIPPTRTAARTAAQKGTPRRIPASNA